MVSETFTSEFSLDIVGEVDVSERIPREEDKFFDSETLVALKKFDDMELRANYNRRSEDTDDCAGISVSVFAWHIENAETGRAFHTHLKCPLSLEAAIRFRDFLNFAIEGQKP